jgi:hypothetical protein
MALNLSLQALNVPFGTEFPGTVQGLLDLIAQYEGIAGEENFNGLNFGPTEPSADNRDKPWFKTDNSGNPIGFFSWNGSAWIALKVTIPSGSTANRPSSAALGDTYFDTTINVLLIFERSLWRTVAGVPGDIKPVIGSDSAVILAKNPGWSLVTDPNICGRVIGVAGAGSSLTNRISGDAVGVEAVQLTAGQLPTQSVPLKNGWDIFPGQFQNGTQSPGVYPITTGLGTTNTTGNIGNNETHVNMQPTLFAFWISKD